MRESLKELCDQGTDRRTNTDCYCYFLSSYNGSKNIPKALAVFDDKSPFVTSGIRVGTAAISTRGLKEEDMGIIVDFIDRAIINHNELDSLHKIGSQVIDFMKKRPLFAG